MDGVDLVLCNSISGVYVELAIGAVFKSTGKIVPIHHAAKL